MTTTVAPSITEPGVERVTPRCFYDALDAHFHFTLDPCATARNAKCARFFTREDDGLVQSWAGHRVFMHPPDGGDVGRWVRKAYHESLHGAEVVVCLLPLRTDADWFFTHVSQADALWLITDRLCFTTEGSPADRNQGPWCVVVLRGPAGVVRSPVLWFWDWQHNMHV